MINPISTFMFKGSVHLISNESKDHYRSGDIVYSDFDGCTYMFDGDTFIKLNDPALSEHDLKPESRQLIDKCPNCGGPVFISTEDMFRGYKNCDYCGSNINIFKDVQV